MQSLGFVLLSWLTLAFANNIPPPLSTCILGNPCPTGSTCTPTQTCGYVVSKTFFHSFSSPKHVHMRSSCVSATNPSYASLACMDIEGKG